MNIDTNQMTFKSMSKRASDMGLILGVYMSVMFFVGVAGMQISLLNILSTVMFLLIPFIVYRALRRFYVATNGFATFSMLWMYGILLFFFSSLICAISTFTYIEWINPTFISDQINSALKLYQSVPEFAEMANIMQEALSTGVLPPSNIEFVFQMIWLTIFSGSVLSIFESLIARIGKVKNNNDNINNINN